jgi:16S rRNA processing protein RimM
LTDQNNLLVLGKIAGTHGLKGDLKIFSYSGEMDSFAVGNSIFAKTPDGQLETLTIKRVKPHKKGFLIAFQGLDHINKAEPLVGSELSIKKTDLPELEDGTYYWHQLVGLEVFSIQEDYLGKVVSIIETGSNDVYVVQDGKKEILIPALEWVVLTVDLASGRMVVDLPEGL